MSHELDGRVFVDGSLVDGRVVVSEGRIERVDSTEPSTRERLIVPAFVDVHVHGGGGSDFADGDPDSVIEATRMHARNGTGSLIASVVSSSPDSTMRAIGAIRQARSLEDPGAAWIAGIHLEGPWISPSRAGAHDRDALRLPDPEELERWLTASAGVPLYVTLAPELDGALEVIERFSRRVSFAIGHTDCDYATALDAISRGARGFTHLFNAMKPLHHREPGPIAAALISEDVRIELIADGVHVHPVVVQLVTRLAASRCLLVTDAMRAAGCGEGRYRLGTLEVEVRDGEARLESGALAGSVLTMAAAVRNMVELAGLPIDIVIPMATSKPGSFASLARKGRIQPGFDADLVVLDERLDVEAVMLRGEWLR